MLAKRIIPCLDVHEGRVVKGINFVNLRDAGDPVEQAVIYDREGADELVFLDITATHEARETMLDVVRRVADAIFIPFCVGGGLRTVEDMRATLLAGADKIAINSSAVRTPDLISEGAERFGSQCIVVAIDARWNGTNYEVYVSGGRIPTGIDAIQWAREVEQRGAGEILLTSMDRDGTQGRLRDPADARDQRRGEYPGDRVGRGGRARSLPRGGGRRRRGRRAGRQPVSLPADQHRAGESVPARAGHPGADGGGGAWLISTP